MLKHLIIIVTLLLFFSSRIIAQYGSKDYASVGGQKSGNIVLGLFKTQQGVGAYHFTNGNHWEDSQVDSFRVALFRDSSLIFSHHNRGYIFDSELTKRFKDLKVGDRVLIYDIWATWPGIPQFFLQPLEYLMR